MRIPEEALAMIARICEQDAMRRKAKEDILVEFAKQCREGAFEAAMAAMRELRERHLGRP